MTSVFNVLNIATTNKRTADEEQKGRCLHFTAIIKQATHLGYYTENVGESTARAIRSTRGRGGHAYQLEKALNPISGDQVRKVNDRIPEDIPVNAMAPQASRKGRSGKNGVIILLFYFYQL
jgi:hypothetical protein